MKRCYLAALSICLSLAHTSFARAEGGSIAECDRYDSVQFVVLPLEKGTKAYANGDIRIWHVDTGGEPVCCSTHLIIIAPNPEDELGFPQCKRLADSEGNGFQWLYMDRIKADYDPARGLLLTVPVERYKDGITALPDVMRVRINQATGSISLE